ncbi:hypothetical protein PMI15_02590 [Polaromonas sp. CF318]|uniref:hypothetical protein n=1 Tax=Polaromonas sp. CF318 TaxID=1144318 RepID=UPI000271014B|nr:hypothetical protein [Polaromonas sp. CF318]EJL83577.1 hypothetical protein PMI15_02590 [Polaromonas sp. CF318]
MMRGIRRMGAVGALVAGLFLACGIAAAPARPVASAEHVRGVEQTLLTYPEWFLVFSPYEYGEFIAANAPSRFPYYGHIAQFWESYKAVFDETRRRALDLNAGYHLMIMVIGTSTSVEYALKSAYETLIGRLAESTAGHPTPEDRHAAAVAQDYVRFIRVQPWYEYDFGKAMAGLWQGVPATGPDMLRKWERRFALTTEYAVKMAYARLIKLGTKSIYDAPLPVTAVVARPAPAADAALPELKLLQPLPDGAALVTIPRYEAFMTYAQALAGQGVNFSEIAGNDSFILVSVLAPGAWKPESPAAALLVQPILTQPGTQRVVMTLPVAHLAEALRQWKTAKLQVEHVFDY